MNRGRDYFKACWLAEWLRLREAHWGPMEDGAEVRRARLEGRNFTHRILLRARFLCRRENLDSMQEHWIRGARLALLVLGVLAIAAGAGAALSTLGNGAVPVNIALALTAMLGLHCLTYLLWLSSFAIHHDVGAAGLGQAWLWLTRKLARGPDLALMPNALAGLLGRNGSLRWVLGGISHGLWTLAFLSLLTVLLAVLSARRYDFNWQTTLLTPDTFVHLTAILGWLPSQLGFAIPSEAIVRASNGLHAVPDAARTLWSSWLIGCVVSYGLLPRVIGLALAIINARRLIGRLTIDESLPGYADLRQRLAPTSENTGIDAPDAPDALPMSSPGIHRPGPGEPAMAGIELPPDLPWPPAPTGDSIADLGIIDSRAQRQAVLERLQRLPPSRILIVCDARQTPDRGAIALITELAGIAGDTLIALAGPDNVHGARPRLETWRKRLLAAGFAAEQIFERMEPAMTWLANKAEAKHD